MKPLLLLALPILLATPLLADAPQAVITGTEDGTIACAGQPVGVIRTKEPVTNFELVVEWRHNKPADNSGIFVRAINGEVCLWVNGTELSGGTHCDPATGYLCLESEGSPIDFRNLRTRALP